MRIAIGIVALIAASACRAEVDKTDFRGIRTGMTYEELRSHESAENIRCEGIFPGDHKQVNCDWEDAGARVFFTDKDHSYQIQAYIRGNFSDNITQSLISGYNLRPEGSFKGAYTNGSGLMFIMSNDPPRGLRLGITDQQIIKADSLRALTPTPKF